MTKAALLAELTQQYGDWESLLADIGDARMDQPGVAGPWSIKDIVAHLTGCWMLYLPVGDLAESLRRVQEEGGTVVKAMQGDDGEHVYAAVQDPVGAYLALMPG